ncbi:hypothetical protein FI667_g11713, partial [Globisporangium splendens]
MLRAFPSTAVATEDAQWNAMVPQCGTSYPFTLSENGSTSSSLSDNDSRAPSIMSTETRRVCLTCQSSCSLRPGECALRGKKAHKRPKTEILVLRAQVQELETQLAKWRKLGAMRSKPSTDTCRNESGCHAAKSWLRKAVAEYKLLEKARDMNRKLKRELEGVATVHEAFGEFFNQHITPKDLDMLAEVKDQASVSETAMQERAQFYSDLWFCLEELYARTSEIVAAMALRDTRFEFNTIHVDHDPMVGRTHDYISNIPLAYDFRHVEYALWQHILKEMKSDSKQPARQFLTFPPNTSQDDYADKQVGILLINDPVVGETPMEGVHTLRKFVELHRTVFVLTSRFEFADLEIREQGWIVISDASWTDGTIRQPRSLLQLHYKVFAANAKPSVERTEVERLEESVAALQIDKMRDRQSRLHFLLFHELGPPTTI